MQSFLTLIEQIEKELPSSERKIADYVLQNPSAPLFMTMTELAAAAGSSPAIVVRLCKRLNVDGYSFAWNEEGTAVTVTYDAPADGEVSLFVFRSVDLDGNMIGGPVHLIAK